MPQSMHNAAVTFERIVDVPNTGNDSMKFRMEYNDERTCSDGSCDLVMTTIHTNLTNLPHEAEFKTFLVKDFNGNVVKHLRVLSKEDVVAILG